MGNKRQSSCYVKIIWVRTFEIQEFSKVLYIIKEVSWGAEYGIDIQKAVAFLYSSGNL